MFVVYLIQFDQMSHWLCVPRYWVFSRFVHHICESLHLAVNDKSMKVAPFNLNYTRPQLFSRCRPPLEYLLLFTCQRIHDSLRHDSRDGTDTSNQQNIANDHRSLVPTDSIVGWKRLKTSRRNDSLCDKCSTQ